MRIFLLQLVYCYSFSIGGSFDTRELNELKWQIEIDKYPVGFPDGKALEKFKFDDENELKTRIIDQLPTEDDPKYLFITSKSGQRFACFLPEKPAPRTPISYDSLHPKYVAEIVAASFYVKRCLEKSTGWWSYEFCRGKQITQFHSSTGKPDYVEYSLGISTGTYRMPEFAHSTKDRLLYMEEEYKMGTLCDVYGKKVPRKTLVRYECDETLSTSEAYIYSIDEEASCEYVLRIRVGSLCRLPQFMPIKELEEALGIKCYPHIDQEKALRMAHSIHEKKMRKKEGKKLAELAEMSLQSVYRREEAFRRTKVDRQEHRNFRLKLRIRKHIEKVTEEYFKVVHLAKEGEWPSEEKLKAQKSIGKLTQGLVSGDSYDNWRDMDRGLFFFYMNDKDWPKDEYPATLNYVDFLNAYDTEVEKVAKQAITEFEADSIRKKAGKDPNDRLNNVLITRSMVLESLSQSFPSWFPTMLSPHLYKKKADDWGYIQEITTHYFIDYMEGLEDGLNSQNYNKEIIENLVDHIAPFVATVTIQESFLEDSVVNSHWKSHLELLKMMMIARHFGEIRYENLDVGKMDVFGKPLTENEIETIRKEKTWKSYYDLVNREERWNLKEFHGELERKTRALIDEVFKEVWSMMRRELVVNWRKKFTMVEDLTNLLNTLKKQGSTMAVPLDMGNEDEIIRLITKAGFSDVEMKVQVVSTDGSTLDTQSAQVKEAINQLLEETIENLNNRKRAQLREDNYWRVLHDQ